MHRKRTCQLKAKEETMYLRMYFARYFGNSVVRCVQVTVQLGFEIMQGLSVILCLFAAWLVSGNAKMFPGGAGDAASSMSTRTKELTHNPSNENLEKAKANADAKMKEEITHKNLDLNLLADTHPIDQI